MSVTKNCGSCGAEFQARDDRQKFCCLDCRLAWYRTPEMRKLKSDINRYRYKKNPRYTKKPCNDVECPWCRQIFHQSRCNQRFCSRRCREQAAYQRLLKRKMNPAG